MRLFGVPAAMLHSVRPKVRPCRVLLMPDHITAPRAAPEDSCWPTEPTLCRSLEPDYVASPVDSDRSSRTDYWEGGVVTDEPHDEADESPFGPLGSPCWPKRQRSEPPTP